MVRRIGVAVLLLSGLTLLAPDAGARDRFKIAGWSGYSGKVSNGQFRYCGIAKTQVDGTTAALILDHRGGFSVLLINDRFDFLKGRWISAGYKVDHHPWRWGQANMSSKRALLITIPPGNGVFRQVKAGNRLYVRFEGRVIRIALYGTAAAIERTRKCVVNMNDIAQGRAPRYATRRTEPRARPRVQPQRRGIERKPPVRRAGRAASRSTTDAPTKADSTRRIEAVTYAANLLVKAGFRNYRILQQKEMRKLAGNRFDVVWRTGASIGALRIYAGRQAKDFDTLAARAIVGGTRACKGGFRSGVKREANSPVLRFFTQCDGDDGWQALYAIVRGKAGKAYLIVSMGNGLTDRNDGLALRQVDDRLVRAMTGGPLQ